MKLDVIVVGAGPGGCLAARDFAVKGLKVGLFDTSTLESLGPNILIEIEEGIFRKVGVKPPTAEETPYHPRDIHTFTSGGTPGYTLSQSPSRAVYHDKFVRALAKDAIEVGAKFYEKHKAVCPIVENERVTGVEFRVGRKKKIVHASLVIDATGYAAALVSKLGPEFGFDFTDDSEDIVEAANYMHVVHTDKAEKAIEKGLCGDEQVWIRFGKGGAYSTEMYHLSLAQKRAYILIGVKDPYRKEVPERIKAFKEEQGYYGKKILGGQGKIRIRRALPRLVADGFMVIGEAACQVIPAHGSGAASAMWAAHLAANVAAPIIKSRPPTTSDLWPYAYQYMTGRGRVLAVYDAFRLAISDLTGDQICQLLKVGVIGAAEFINAAIPRLPQFELKYIPGQIAGIAKNPFFIKYLFKIAMNQEKVKRLYANYPRHYDPTAFVLWKEKEKTLFNRLYPGRG